MTHPDAPRHWAGLAARGVALAAASAWALRHPAVVRADVAVHHRIARVDQPVVDAVVVSTTDLGSVYAVVGCAATLWAAGRRRTAVDVAAAGAAAWLVAQQAKHRVDRVRPYDAHGVRRLIRPPTGSSFPSGHACVATTVATVLATHTAAPGRRAWWSVLAGWVVLTRVYVGVHYPTDVLGGAGMGLVFGALWRGPLARLSPWALRLVGLDRA